ncbi:hypothetical protein GP486_004294 [Trichoglossum hirsutum]|uniref:Prion-inhibition and propagation HeLo domain-containing protein n=1 Tax=Trichoglossum hirsutum TaxID=265104 RepID=A0A9P8LBL8_9PEZI|nr:hypothetical protein GP486_004294 [Trichoglossum hirsutum]
MVTGIELAGLILATFPLVISTLEHYENGFQQIKEWVRFRGEFAMFLNAMNRQKIFFRQNIEELLSPIVASEYEMSQLLDAPGGPAWMDEELNEKLRKRLPGKYEYECYISTVSAILELLEKLKHKLKIVDGQVGYSSRVAIQSLKPYAKTHRQASLGRGSTEQQENEMGDRIQTHQLHPQ